MQDSNKLNELYALHDVLLKSYTQDPNIICNLTEYLHDELDKKFDLNKFNYNDNEKCFDVELKKPAKDVEPEIKNIFVQYISKNTNDLKDSDHENIIDKIIKEDKLKDLSSQCITVLNLSTKNTSEFKINLHN